MSEDEHSDRLFYYPDELESHNGQTAIMGLTVNSFFIINTSPFFQFINLRGSIQAR